MSAHHGIKRVVLLHGVGGTGASMRPIAEHLGRGVETYSPDGPAAFDMGAGRQWFSVLGVTEANRPARVAAALPAFAATIARFGDLHDTVLIGFSQGAIMALHAAAAGLRPAGVIAIAGRLSGPVDQQPVWPKITLLHGTADQIMPPDFARRGRTGTVRRPWPCARLPHSRGDTTAHSSRLKQGVFGKAASRRTCIHIHAALANPS
jgi:phospholipase/carboxylesterase